MTDYTRNSILVALFSLILVTSLSGCDPFGLNFSGSNVMIAPADDTMVPDQMKEMYRESAARLVLREIRQSMNLAQAGIDIPEDKAENYYRAFVHVYNMETVYSDTVTRILPIFTFPDIELQQLIVSFDEDLPWTREWRKGHRLTGNEEIDALMEQYNLELLNYHAWPFGHAVVLKSPVFINLAALAPKFTAVDGIQNASPNGRCCDGHNVRATWDDPLRLILEYSAGFGDCPAGCINRRFWEFEVHVDGTVTFLRTHGQPLP